MLQKVSNLTLSLVTVVLVATSLGQAQYTLGDPVADKPGVEVSWQVTGIRHDTYANQHRIKVEEPKPESLRNH